MTYEYPNSEPRDLTGTPAHAKLRAALGVPVGGHRRDEREAQQAQKTRDIIGNLQRSIQKRHERFAAERREKSIKAWPEYQAGATLLQLAKKYHISQDTLVSQWKQLNYAYNPGRGPRPIDRSDDARAAWQDRQEGYSLKYVLAKYNISQTLLYRYWRRMGLK